MGQDNNKQRDDLEVVTRHLQRRERHLTTVQKAVLERVSFCDDVIRRHGPGEQTYEMVAQKFDVSTRQARRYCEQAEYVYGSQPRLKKEYWRRAVFEKLYQAFAELSANVDEEMSGFEGVKRKVDTEKITALTRMAAEIRKTVGYDKDDVETPPPGSDITHIEIGADPAIIGADFIDNDRLKEVLDRVTRVTDQAATDVDHEEVK